MTKQGYIMNSSQCANNMTTFGRLPKNIDRTETQYYIIYRYYCTDIVRIENDNVGTKITLSTGGYYTKSTRNHMINMLNRENITVDISFSSQFMYRVIYKGKCYYFDMNDKCEFYL